eukprot:gene7502-8778_t
MAKRLPLKDLYYSLHDARSCVLPNDGFMRQLMELEVRLLGKSSFVFGEWKNTSKAKITTVYKEATKALKTSNIVTPPPPAESAGELQAYISQILTTEMVLEAIGNEESFSRLRTLIDSKRSCFQEIGIIKQTIARKVFEQTNGGESFRLVHSSIAWRDISSVLCTRVIEVLEKDLFGKPIPASSK